MADFNAQRLAMMESRKNSGVATTMVIFSFAMLILPVSSYFLSKVWVFEASLGYDSSDSYFYAAIVAVVMVHVILAVFVFVAFTEDYRSTPAKLE
ncbi:vacuolar ATPase assembly integral membrane protein vma21-like [Liolophura sinensis]|uniref:vacuolar ATPase assembly integral membrane protein vma21-like n=1 Tax=Liolophura sinensis TaxID=3198878 RepID=UPI0031590870